MNFVKIAQEVFDIEIEELIKVKNKIDDEFKKIVEAIYECKGKIVLTGIGKTGIIAKKIASSLASTGTSAFYINSAEALHGDLGMIQNQDVVIIISNSGNSQEVINMLPSLNKIGCMIIGITGNKKSELARNSKYILDSAVEREACPLNLAPTASTTAALLLGDALTAALIKKNQFKKEEFALYHPGGALGRKLLTEVKDIMVSNIPRVYEESEIMKIIYEICNKGLGLVIVYNGNEVSGLITDGDIRRMLINNVNNLNKIKAKDIMTREFKKISPNIKASEALQEMHKYNISNLVVVEGRKVVGIITMRDVLDF